MSPISEEVYRKVVRSADRGGTRPEELLKLIHGRTVNRCGSDTLIAALTGFVTGVDRDMLRFYMEECLLYEGKGRNASRVWRTYARSTTRNRKNSWRPYRGWRAKRDVRLSEAGHDMATFPSASALVGWAGLEPRNQMSAGKIKGRKITHGNRFLRIVLVQCAWARPGAGDRVRPQVEGLKRRMPAQKALVAIAEAAGRHMERAGQEGKCRRRNL